MDLLVVAKEPVAGRVKTRLCPPCTPMEAAAIAAAALHDTLHAALASSADRVVIALDGNPGSWLPAGVEVIPQGDGSLADRLSTAWRAANGPAVQIGMDTPQVTAADLDAAFEALARADAVLGRAADGGWWAVGMRNPDPGVFAGIPTSRDDTGARQHDRLVELGLAVDPLPVLRDVDTWSDAVAVAIAAPSTMFANAVGRLA